MGERTDQRRRTGRNPGPGATPSRAQPRAGRSPEPGATLGPAQPRAGRDPEPGGKAPAAVAAPADPGRSRP
ncbi:hypothetical protein GCM10022420_071800 [Streptomyces iranensis]